MPRILDVKAYSINAKVALSLSLLALLLITILFALIVPKIQEDKYNRTIKEIEQVLSITEEQIKLAGQAIMMQSELEIKGKLQNSEIINFTNYAIKYRNQTFINKNEEIYKNYKMKKYDKWEKIISQKVSRKEYVYNIKYFFYTKKISNDLEITLFYEDGMLNKNHFTFEDKLKKNLQNTFNITQDLHKGKSYIFWLNSKFKNEGNIPLYVENLKESQKKYTLSKMSNVSNIYTGDLSARKIMEIKNKRFVEHTLNNKKAISWVRDLYEEEYDGYIFLLVKTIYKEDLIKRIDSTLLKILPAAIISLSLALMIGYFIFKRLFKSINTLTDTAKKINNGDTNIRSKVIGNDDVGILGIAFDSMLDSFANNIKNLDSKVEEKTKKLQSSLEEKDILLKEIHHRVKNNLALTISLIKLQQEEIHEEKSKKSLIDIQERIYTMELLHRKLYESPNLNQINFKEYIINLINNISSAYMNNKDFKIDTKIDDFYLTIEKAMPIGLILNEIITNAFKYAFKDNLKPYLLVSMKKDNKKFILIIKDNGKGIKSDINIYHSNTLGLKLINSISKLQLKGKLEYKYDEGAEFKVIFE